MNTVGIPGRAKRVWAMLKAALSPRAVFYSMEEDAPSFEDVASWLHPDATPTNVNAILADIMKSRQEEHTGRSRRRLRRRWRQGPTKRWRRGWR